MRRRSGVPGRRRPDGHDVLLLLVAAMGLALSACDAAAPTTSSDALIGTSGTQSPGEPSSATPSTPSTEPVASPPEPGSESPTDSPTPGGSFPNEGAMACTGSDENRDFFASMAAAVDWAVYCPVLADGWFVEDGSYRLAGGGWMEITYNGPGGAHVLLRQGFFCEDEDGCVPPGQEVDAAPFGDRQGRLISGDDGNWSVAADRGSRPSWLIVISGLGETEARAIAADLHLVA